MTIEKHERSTKDLVKAAVSGWLGTALEFMDFQLYSLGAALVFHEIANHNTAASGDCVTVTIVGRHRCFLLSDLQSKPT